MVFSEVTKKTTHGGGYKRIDLIFGTVFAFLFAIIVGSIIFSGVASAYDFSVTIPEGEILEVKLFNSDGTTMGSTTSMNVTPTSLSSPGFNEKDVVVSVGTSNEWGYNLVMNVSNTTPTSEQDPNNTIANLTNKSGGYTCTPETAATCDFTVNSWGFKIKTATNTQEATNYIPVPTAINLNTNNTTTNGDPVYLSFGSRINASQEPGTYTTTINFVATAKPDPRPAMQNMDNSTLASLIPNNGDTILMKDVRDGSGYPVTNINGTYWMNQNLRIMGTVSASLSNFAGADFNISAGGDLTLGNDYTVARAHYDNDTTYGAYYNYCAASAGTVCSNTAQVSATSDICPSGWRLPNRSEIQSIVNSAGAFNATFAGRFDGGTLGGTTTHGMLWSATAYDNERQNYMSITTTSSGLNQGYKYRGYSVRCVYGPLPTMQSMTSAKLAELMPTDGSTTTLPDSRDMNVYNIARIGDAYWMTDNLKIMGTISASESNFTGADFNISAGGDLTAGDTYTVPRAHYNTSDANSSTYGAYYNYCAASAGTVCSQTPQHATVDICPKGWRLPTKIEITTIKNNNGTNFNLVRAGYYREGQLNDASSVNFWWSGSAAAISSATDNHSSLYYNGSKLDVSNYPKYFGFSVRCVYGPLPPTMQSVDSAKLAELMPTDGSTTTLPDSRDMNVYNIARIGNTYWMTDNLRFAGTSLTPADTNVTQNTTMSYFNLPSKKSDTSRNSYTSAGITNNGTYGVYYNYCAASAGTVCNNTTKQDATSDICPKGWRLPTYTEITTIRNNNGTNFNLVLAGYYYSGLLRLDGSRGNWWSATAYNTNSQYALYYDGSSWVVDLSNRDFGFSVRCVAGS